MVGSYDSQSTQPVLVPRLPQCISILIPVVLLSAMMGIQWHEEEAEIYLTTDYIPAGPPGIRPTTTTRFDDCKFHLSEKVNLMCVLFIVFQLYGCFHYVQCAMNTVL